MARNAIAFEVQDRDSPEAKKAGAYTFMRYSDSDEPVGVIHACPCGCGGQGAIWFRGKSRTGAPEWDVTGEWPKVTLSPSIGFAKSTVTGTFHWHGYLENGVWVER